jgi:hypothetical protein
VLARPLIWSSGVRKPKSRVESYTITRHAKSESAFWLSTWSQPVVTWRRLAPSVNSCRRSVIKTYGLFLEGSNKESKSCFSLVL